MELMIRQGIMQKCISFIYFVLLLLFVSGCKTNLDDLYNKLNDHDERLKLLENRMKTANEEIKKIDILIKGQENKLSIVSYTETTDKKGYELTMSNGSIITLKHGNTPVVNVKKHTDGILYWTIDGEFIKDTDENMIKAQGSDGATPTLRVNTLNQWEVSSDGGKSWRAVLGSNNEPVSATGPKGESAITQLEIKEVGDAVIITYNGATYVIAKATAQPIRPKLPIEYVAEYNINVVGDNFTANHGNDVSGLFNWYEATGTKHHVHNPSGGNILNAGVFKDKYYLASHSEWRGVLPDEIIDWNDRERIKTNIEEEIMVAGVIAKYTADYNKKRRNICYAIRFKGDDDKYRCAYRYQYTDNLLDTETKHKKMVVITVRYLGAKDNKLTLTDVSEDAFWREDGVEYITRTLPMAGNSDIKSGEIFRRGERAWYWTSTEHPEKDYTETYAIFVGLFEAHLQVTKNAYLAKTKCFAIRPFIKY